jgi:hypothetical protein
MKFTIPVTWTVGAKIEIEAPNLEEAFEKLESCDLPEGSYVADSLVIGENIDCALE